MRLLEVVPTPDTSNEVLSAISELCAERLGKVVIRAKDTPGFIANRIGVHAIMVTIGLLEQAPFTIEELDAITGRPLGRPQTATFALADLVGIDTLAAVARDIHDRARTDLSRADFEPPAFVERMIERGLVGRKAGAGFFRRTTDAEKKLLVVERHSLVYRPHRPFASDALAQLGAIADPAERIRALLAGSGIEAAIGWRVLAATLSYSAMRLGEIADDAASIDAAMRLGFNWELGPFEIWDALGFRATFERLQQEGRPLPPWIVARHASGAETLHATGSN
jgi:3-hydroxyacyl-CoA dehydrogenase